MRYASSPVTSTVFLMTGELGYLILSDDYSVRISKFLSAHATIVGTVTARDASLAWSTRVQTITQHPRKVCLNLYCLLPLFWSSSKQVTLSYCYWPLRKRLICSKFKQMKFEWPKQVGSSILLICAWSISILSPRRPCRLRCHKVLSIKQNMIMIMQR